MRTMIHFLGAGILAAGLVVGTLPGFAAEGGTASGSVTAPKVKEFGGKMPLPVDQRIERQNSPADKLVVEVTHSVQEGTQYVAYVKVVWGDLDNVITGTGKQYYSNWDGSLALAGATGVIDQKIQFDDGRPKTTTAAAPKKNEGPRVGSGRDEVEVAAGATIKWEAAVVGVIDGVRIKITSPTAEIHGTLIAGKFTLPLVIRPAVTPSSAPAARSVAPKGQTVPPSVRSLERIAPGMPARPKAPAQPERPGILEMPDPTKS
jgi:hypothetical protein